MPAEPPDESTWMQRALELARQGYGLTSPNPMVGAVLVKANRMIGEGWHQQAGGPHAEVEALRHARSRRRGPKGATLYVTLEPCSTEGRTPPCTKAILQAGIQRVVVAAVDPNPAHAGRGLELLRQAGLEVVQGVLEAEATRLNEAFNHWIVRNTPFVTVKAAMTLDGKIATVSGESKWITGEKARAQGMELRRGADAILVGVNTVLADNPSLTWRPLENPGAPEVSPPPPRRRIVLDTRARTPLNAMVVTDSLAHLTTVVVAQSAPPPQVEALQKLVTVVVAPLHRERIDLKWLLRKLGEENVTSLLVEGGGEVNASFLLSRLAQRVAFFYAPKILGGSRARKAVAGSGATRLNEAVRLLDPEWQCLDADLYLQARVE